MGQLIKINTKKTETDELTEAAETYTAGKGTLVKIGSKAAPTTQTGAQSAPRSAGTSKLGTNYTKPAATTSKGGAAQNGGGVGRTVTGKAAESGYTQQKAAQQQTANRQTVKDWWKREQQKAAEDDSTERARTAKITGGANIDNSKEFIENTKKTFGGIQDDADTQRKRALQSKMGVGANWGNPKTAVGNAVESAAAGTTASLLNALGTVLQDDGKRQGLAVDSGAITDPTTTGNEWYNRAGRYLQGEADKVQKISEDAYTRGSEGLTNAQKLLFDVGIAGAQMLGDRAFGAAAPIVMAARGFGSGSMQARKDGGSHTEQVLYGAASAAVEVLTEKMFDGVAHVYGKGAADDVVQKVAEKLAKTPRGQSVIRAIVNAGGEGLEEMISAAIDPALQTIYNDKTINGRRYGEKGAYDDVKIADILYDGLIGTLLGFAGGSVDVAQTMRSGESVSGQAQGAEGNKNSGSINQELNMGKNPPQLTPKAPLDPVASADNIVTNSQEGVNREDKKTKTQIDTSQASALADDPSGYKPVSSDEIVPAAEQRVNSAEEKDWLDRQADETVARIIEAFTTDDGYVDEQKQKQLIYYHGEELFNRAVTEAFERGLITNDGRGNIYSLKAETRAPGYYGAKGKNAKYLDNLAKAAGMTIIRGNLSNGEQGFYINGRAVLAADAGVEIARHEVAHHLKQAAPEEFGEFMNYAKSVYGDKLDAALERIRSDYAAKGENLSAEVAEEELAAYFAGQLMTDETAMKRLAGENLSLAERFLAWIKESLAKVGRALGMESTEAKQLREGAALFEKAIRAAKNGTAATDGAVRHSLGDTGIKRDYIHFRDYKEANTRIDQKVSDLIAKGKTVALDPQSILEYEPQADWNDKKSVRKLLDRILKPYLGVSVDFEYEGNAITAYLTRTGIDHARGGGASPRKAAAYELYKELVKNAEYTFSTQHEDHSKKGSNRGNNVEWDTFVAAATINDEPYPVAFTVRTIDTEIRSQVYSIATKKETDFSRGDGGRNDPTVAHPSYGSSSISNEKLTQMPPVVKDTGEIDESSGKRSAYEGTAEALQDIQRLQRQNVRLSEQVAQLQSRVREAGRGTDRDSVKAQVKNLKKRYGSRVNTNELTDSIVALYDDMSANTISNEEMRQRAGEIAQKLLDGAVRQINPLYDEYEELRKMLRSRRIHLSEADRADLDHVGGYNALRQKNMGRLMLTKDGAGVDTLYEELSENYPELFPDDVYSPADQLIRISDVLDDLAAVEGNPFEQTPGARDFLAGDILERFFGTPQTYKAELQRDRAAMEQRLEKAKDEYRKRLEVIEKRHAAENQERRARATATERREQLMKGTERLTKKLIRPDDKRHIPAEMRETVRAFVSMVNTESGYEYVFQRDGTYKRVKAGSDPYGMSTARTDRARELQAQLRLLEEDGSASIDPNLQANLDAIAEMQETKIADMNREQLDLVYETMRAIEKMCQNSDKMLGESKFATVSKTANALLEENNSRKAKTQWKGVLQSVDDLAELDMMTPETFFHKMGKAGDELYRQMRRSADKQTRILAEGVEHAKKVIGESGLDIKALEHEVHDFELESGEKLTMTTAQIMELHALWKREQARDHILEYGGIKPTKIEGKGLRASAAVRAEKVSLNDLAKILSVLTNEQRALVDNLQKFMAGGLAQHGNEASRMVYGYDKFTEPNYWPIHVNKAEVATDPGKAAQAKTIVGFGMAKATKPKASNGLEIGSFLDTYTKHLSEMATYAGWLATSENLTRVNNFKFTDGAGMPTGETVKTVLEKIYGRGGDAYWQKLMGDIAQGTKAGSDGTIMDKITGNTKAAAVGANLRVILQQPTSILRAMNIVHPKYFTQKGSGDGWEKALKYSGIAKWKDWGYFEMDTGRSVRGLITGPENKVEQLRETSMAAAGKADSMSWGILWNAVENETRDKHPELSGDALYEAAAERFGEIIDRTQVVDSVLHRSQIMRKGGLNKMATSFMSEPSKVYNMVMRDIYDVTAAAEGKEKNVAKKKLARTMGTLTFSFAANAVAQAVVDAMRDDDREKEYWEKFAENWVENFADNFNALNYIPYVKDIVSVFSGYDVSRMDMDAISDAKQAMDQLAKSINGTGKKTVLNAGVDAANEVAAIFGLPIANVKRDLLAAVNTAFSEARMYRMQYELDKALYDIDYTGSRVRWWKILYEASKDNWDDYEAIYYDMLKQGLTVEQIKKGMENQMKADNGVSSVKELPYRWTPPNERSMFNSSSKEISKIEGPKRALDIGLW